MSNILQQRWHAVPGGSTEHLFSAAPGEDIEHHILFCIFMISVSSAWKPWWMSAASFAEGVPEACSGMPCAGGHLCESPHWPNSQGQGRGE